MELETFDDVKQAIAKNPNRKFHLLLGNGFSMAYNPGIFSYNALHDFVTKLEDPDLNTILDAIGSTNFELMMRQLDSFATLLEAFGGNAALKSRVEAASAKLKKGLLDAVRSLHPEHVFAVPEEESACCSRFLNIFLSSGGKIFSTNYDLLLYWVLLRNGIVNHVDGFGRELLNPDEIAEGEEPVWSDELIWGKHRGKQNVFYLHGALPYFDTGVEIVKEEYDGAHYLLEKISARMESGDYPVFVTAGDGRDKLSQIRHNQYLSWCYDQFAQIEGSVVTFGFNFGPYDEHIIAAVNEAAKHGKKSFPKLNSIYVGVYSADDHQHIENIKRQFACKLHVFDAKTADVWRLVS